MTKVPTALQDPPGSVHFDPRFGAALDKYHVMHMSLPRPPDHAAYARGQKYHYLATIMQLQKRVLADMLQGIRASVKVPRFPNEFTHTYTLVAWHEPFSPHAYICPPSPRHF